MDPIEQRKFAFDSPHHVGLHRLPLYAGLSRDGGDLPPISQRGPHQRITGMRQSVERQSVERQFVERQLVMCHIVCHF